MTAPSIGALRGRLGAGMADSLTLDRMSTGQLERVRDDVVALLDTVCRAHAASLSRPRGKARLRLVVSDGMATVSAQEWAGLRRRRPVHVKGAAS